MIYQKGLNGGGIEHTSHPNVRANWIIGNQAEDDGGYIGWMLLEKNIIADNLGQGISYRQVFRHLMPSVVQSSIIYGNRSQIELLATETGPPQISHSLIEGGYPSQENSNRDPRYEPGMPAAGLYDVRVFVNDTCEAAILDRSYDSAGFTTTFKIGSDCLHNQDLAGRVVRIGNQWSVVRSSGQQSLTVWGSIKDAAESLVILGT